MLTGVSVACAGARPAVRAPRQKRLVGSDVIAACFAGLEGSEAILLAVSGGPDSMALLLMAARWVRDRKVRYRAGAPSVHVATVDHGLRPGSLAEAQTVAALAEAHGFRHAILSWTGPKPSSRVQERARDVRYGLLADHARSVRATHVLTAHHADDQAETVLLRLGRGSGVAGLAGMRRVSPLQPGLWLVRPLLGVTKDELIAVCRADDCAFVDDPTNRDPAFARARLRGHAAALAGLGLDTRGLVRLARRMARAEAALEAETDRVEAILAPKFTGGALTIGLAPSSALAPDLSPEIFLRLVRRAIDRVARPDRVRLDRLEALVEALRAARAEGRPYRATLAGTRLALTQDAILEVRAEAPRSRGCRPPRLREGG